MTKIRPVILAGRSDALLPSDAPSQLPKQFQPLIDEDSPFQDILERLSVPEFSAALVIAHEDDHDTIMTQCDAIDLDFAELFLESKSSKIEAILKHVAQWAIMNDEGDVPLLICPTDHIVEDPFAFERATFDAAHTAAQGHFVCFGLVAEQGDPAYDYIQVGTRLDTRYSGHHILNYIDAPDASTAQNLFDQGGHVWNSGIYCATANTLLSLFEKHNDFSEIKHDKQTIVVSLLTSIQRL